MKTDQEASRASWLGETPASILSWCSSLSLLWSIGSLGELLGAKVGPPLGLGGVFLAAALLRLGGSAFLWGAARPADRPWSLAANDRGERAEGSSFGERVFGFLALACAGPALLFFPGLREQGGLFLAGIAACVGVCLAWDLRLLFQALASLWRGEIEPSSLPLISWKTVVWLAILLFPWFLRPYAGRAAAVWATSGLVCLWFLPARAWALTSWFERPWPFLAWLAPLAFFGGFGLQSTPWPQGSSDREILYSARLGSERLTLQASRQEELRVLHLVARRALLYQSIQAYRYAEMLIHPAFSIAKKPPKRVLLLGGEDGSLLREIAKYPSPPTIVWVPLFREWADFFQTAPLFREEIAALQTRLQPKRFEIFSPETLADWHTLLRQFEPASFDLLLLDLPPPQALFEVFHQPDFQKELLRLLHKDGLAAIHLGSVTNQRRLFWCLIGQWLRQKIHTTPYFLAPSGVQDHGFALLSHFPLRPAEISLTIPVPTRYLHAKQPFSVLTAFPKTELPDGRDFSPMCQIGSVF